MTSDGQGVTRAPAPASRARAARRVLAAAGLVALLAVAAAAVVSPSLRWSARAMLARPDAAGAWRRLPGGRPIVAVLDVRALLRSPVGREIRPELASLVRSLGLELDLAERNARVVMLASDGRGTAVGVAAGPRLSPLLLPRFDSRWRRAEGAAGPVVTDGSSVIAPLQPGIVAFAVSESGQDASAALEEGLASAQAASQEPLDADGAALRLVVIPDDRFRRRMTAGLPRQAATYAAGIASLRARIDAGDDLRADVRLTMVSEDAAAATAAALQQLDQVLSTGLVSLLAPFLGEDAAVLAKVPPFDVDRSGSDVEVTVSATPQQLRDLLRELDRVSQPR